MRESEMNKDFEDGLAAPMKWLKELRNTVRKAVDELDDTKEILLENPDGTVKTVTVLRETETGYHCNDRSSLWKLVTGGTQIFLQKDDPRIRSVHRRGLK